MGTEETPRENCKKQRTLTELKTKGKGNKQS